MPWTLTTTAPDGARTVNNPVDHQAGAALAVTEILARVAPWLNHRERTRIALQVTRDTGRTYAHTATGYRFRIDTTEES